VFIDEAGVNIAMSRLFARSPQGSRAYGERPEGRGKNVTMIGAMSTEGIIAAMTFTGGTNTSAFKTYVTQILVPNLWSGATVVMDNFSSHITGIKEAIKAVGARLVYLSPYSPCRHSPALKRQVRTRLISHQLKKNCWCGRHCRIPASVARRQGRQSKVKEFLRSQAARTYQELARAITTALNAVTKKDIIGWFTHCCYYSSSNWEPLYYLLS
jgi:hypothetical protein